MVVVALRALLSPLSAANDWLLRIGRHLAWMALAVMVLVIFLQVVFRYLLNSALPWPEELARFLMLWMTGLVAPSAWRQGGFVAIDMLPRALPARLGTLLNLLLTGLCLVVLLTALPLGLKHIQSGCLFNSSTLHVPFTLELNWLSPCSTETVAWGGFEWNRVKLTWMFLSLFVCLLLLVAVSVELILHSLLRLVDPASPPDGEPEPGPVSAD